VRKNHEMQDAPAGALDARPQPLVYIANALARSAQGLSLSEKRVVMCAVAKLESQRALTPGTTTSTRITAAEYAEHAECGMNAAYEALKSASDRIFERKISFFRPPRKPSPSGKQVFVVMRWVCQKEEYHDREGWVELHWSPGILPYLTGLKSNFTKYQLQQASALRSIYSWRLLELLSQFNKTGWLEITIEEFAHAMEANEKQQSDFARMRTRMIEPAVKELTDKDGWLIQWKTIKAGRKVAALRFDFMRNPPQGRLALDVPAQPAPQHPLALEGPGPSPKRRRATPPPADPVAALAPAGLDLLEQPKGRRAPPPEFRALIRQRTDPAD